jgi:hypothetical protein
MTRARDLANIADGTFTATDLDLSGTLTVSGDAAFDTNTLFVDVSANAVGIGTTSPSGNLEIATSAADTGVDLVLDGNKTSNGGIGSIIFNNNGDSVGMIRSNRASANDAADMLFYTQATGGANTERMRIDSSGNVGIGVVPEAWNSGLDALQVGLGASIAGNTSNPSRTYINANAYINTSNVESYVATDEASQYFQNAGTHVFKVAPSGAADTAISWTTAMTVDNSGNLLVGTAGVPNSLAHGTALVSSSGSGGDVVAFREESSVNVGDRIGAFVIGNSDIDGAEDHYVGMWAKASSTNGSMDLHFAAGRSGYEGDLPQMTLDSSGNLLVGTTSTSSTVAGTVIYGDSLAGVITHTYAGRPLYINRLSTDGDIIELAKDGTTVGIISSRNAEMISIHSGTVGIEFNPSNQVNPSSGTAGLDNTLDLGAAGARWDDIYATNGTIQTSDRNDKQDIAELSDAEARVAVAAKGLLRKFRWKSAVEEKGSDARIHFGIIAQDLQAAFEAEGLDAGRYAMFIHSTWTDEETGEERSRMGVRYSELLAFIIAAL